jgi:ABC-2 type transport system permease protein
MATKMPTASMSLRRFRSPGTAIGRFVARRTMRSAGLWGLVFGAYVTSKSASYAAAYPTALDRTKLAASFYNNIGLEALLGKPHALDTVVGFMVWNTLIIMTMIGSIWAFLLATKTFRGEEDAGRWELLLAGQTTARRAAGNVLAGLGVAVVTLYVVAAAAFILVGRIHSVHFDASSALFFALAAVAGAAQFMAVGALASQLMPTRSRASAVSAAFFGLCFLIRAMADTTSVHWLLNVSPLGWVEQLRPLGNSQPLWLIPIGGFIAVLCALTIILAGRRDLGDSTFADHDSAEPHTRFLNSPLGVAVRITRVPLLSWLLGISLVATFFGALTKSAAQAFADSLAAQHVLNRLIQSPQITGATTYLGVIFFLLTPLIMAFAASSLSQFREEEALGYVDNLLVQPVSRWVWLWSRLGLIAGAVVAAGLLAGFGAWVGAASQIGGLGLHTLLLAGINVVAPAILVLGIGVLGFGLVPRLTGLVAYGIIAWSFLIQLISSGLNLSHWVLDTSILHYVALAPAASPKWGTNLALVGLGLALSIIGTLVFTRRDLASE